MSSSIEASARRARSYSRMTISLPVKISDHTLAAGSMVVFDTTDVSMGGAFLQSSILLEMGEELSLMLVVSPKVTINARARVVRVSYGDPPGMGIRFINLAPKDREAIKALIDTRGPR